MASAQFKEKAVRIIQTIESPVGYRGGESLREINTFLESIYHELAPIVFGETADHRDDGATLDAFKNTVLAGYLNDHSRDSTLEALRTGETYETLLVDLLKMRLKKELGDHYPSKEMDKGLKLKADIALDMNALFPARIISEFGAPKVLFSPVSVILLDEESKKALLCHEVAHLALGHLDAHGPAEHGRRQREFNAHHIGQLLYGNKEEYHCGLSVLNDYNQVLYADSDGKTEQYIANRRARYYERLPFCPGENAVLDKRVESRIEAMRDQLSFAAQLDYPALREIVEETTARYHQVKAADIMLLGRQAETSQRDALHHQRLQEGIKACRDGEYRR